MDTPAESTKASPRVLFQGEYFAIATDEQGCEFVRTGDEVLIVPLDGSGRVLLCIEPSAAFGEPTLILPGGETVDGRGREETATLELQEEIGYLPGRLDYLGELQPFSKYLAARSFVYLGRDLVASRLIGDEGYPIEVVPVELAQFEALSSSGRLQDSRVIAALFLTRAFVERETLL